VLINKTPHQIVIRLESGDVTIPATLPAARVAVGNVELQPVDGIPVSAQQFGAVENLPEPTPNTWYVVSVIVAQALPERHDLLRPDSGPDAIRENGQIVAVRRLVR
jgi:hypothetical protein